MFLFLDIRSPRVDGQWLSRVRQVLKANLAFFLSFVGLSSIRTSSENRLKHLSSMNLLVRMKC
jgi:hypothetical protein